MAMKSASFPSPNPQFRARMEQDKNGTRQSNIPRKKGLPFSYCVLLALSHSEWPQIEGCMVYMSSSYVQLLGHIPILNVLYQLQQLLGHIPILNVLRGHPLAVRLYFLFPCRYDWHQTGSFVIISIYAKACVPEHCSFQVNPTNVRQCGLAPSLYPQIFLVELFWYACVWFMI